MRVAIIGAKGQLGTDLTKVFDEQALPFTHEDLDVTIPESLEILKKAKPDVIINTAAYHKTDECEDNVIKAFNVNAIGALNVARVANEVDAINIYIGTDYVFDGKKAKPYVEEDKPNPINVYGLSKYAGEIFTQNYSKKYYILRVASLFGKAGASGKGGNFVETMIKLSKERKEIRVVNDITMSPTYTKDAAEAIKKIIEKKLPFGIYHVVNSGCCTWYDFAKAIFDILKIDVKVKPISSKEFPTKARRPKNSALSNEKLQTYGIKMRHWKPALKAYLKEKGYLE